MALCVTVKRRPAQGPVASTAVLPVSVEDAEPAQVLTGFAIVAGRAASAQSPEVAVRNDQRRYGR
ncbi:hypothetical protein GCM10010267_44380 [Streptomyces griseorubens]|nr:hypothetical protein GCM10010267_44380 [Streptomyces griseorubens]